MGELYVNNNGEILKNEGPTIKAANRGHLYGDGLFESIRVINGVAINVEAHILRMFDGAIALKMNIPNQFTVDFFADKIAELITRSKIGNGAKVRISLDRKSGGTYKPIDNEATFFMEVYELENNCFNLNEKGWVVDQYTEMRKHKSKLGSFKTKNALLYVMCSIYAAEKGFDDLLITNPKGGIIEGTSSNLFVVSNGVLYTPGLEEGCVGGVMRMTIINLALANNIKVYECAILPQNLLAADELFLTNAIQGVVWISEYRSKVYQSDMAKQLIELLNDEFSGSKGC